MSRVTLVAVAAVAALAALGALALGSRGSGDAAVVVVDGRSGAPHGVRFGDAAADVGARLGEPTDDDGFFPGGADYTGPPAIPNPRSDANVRPTPLHYGDTAYLVAPNAGASRWPRSRSRRAPRRSCM